MALTLSHKLCLPRSFIINSAPTYLPWRGALWRAVSPLMPWLFLFFPRAQQSQVWNMRSYQRLRESIKVKNAGSTTTLWWYRLCAVQLQGMPCTWAGMITMSPGAVPWDSHAWGYLRIRSSDLSGVTVSKHVSGTWPLSCGIILTTSLKPTLRNLSSRRSKSWKMRTRKKWEFLHSLVENLSPKFWFPLWGTNLSQIDGHKKCSIPKKL